MTNESIKGDISLRPVEKGDKELLFHWVNEPEVRKTAYSSGKISWEEHDQWFEEKYSDDKTYIYIGEINGKPIGQIRIECSKQEGTVSVSLDKSYRGLGLGHRLIKMGSERVMNENRSLDILHAWIKENNEASVRAFEKAGYRKKEFTEKNGYPSYHFVFKNS